MYPRKLAPVVEALLADFRIVYLTGPRQAGKTTLARAIAERMDMGYISLDNPAALASARHDPRGLVQSGFDHYEQRRQYQTGTGQWRDSLTAPDPQQAGACR